MSDPIRQTVHGVAVDVLVVGCGTGHHPISIALRYDNAEVVATDVGYHRRVRPVHAETAAQQSAASRLEDGRVYFLVTQNVARAARPRKASCGSVVSWS